MHDEMRVYQARCGPGVVSTAVKRSPYRVVSGFQSRRARAPIT